MEVAGQAGRRGSPMTLSPSLTVPLSLLTPFPGGLSPCGKDSLRDTSWATPMGRELPLPDPGPNAGWTSLSHMPSCTSHCPSDFFILHPKPTHWSLRVGIEGFPKGKSRHSPKKKGVWGPGGQAGRQAKQQMSPQARQSRPPCPAQELSLLSLMVGAMCVRPCTLTPKSMSSCPEPWPGFSSSSRRTCRYT